MQNLKFVFTIGLISIFCLVMLSIKLIKSGALNTGFKVVADNNPEAFYTILDKIVNTKGISAISYQEPSDSEGLIIIFYIFCRKWNVEKIKNEFKTILNVEVG